MDKKHRFKKLVVIALLCCVSCGLIAVFAGLLISRHIESSTRNIIFKKASDVPERPVGIVFGARVWGNEPSNILEDRLSTAIDLYRSGKVRKLILSGDHGRKEYDEVNAMRDYALRNGVKPEDIFLDHAGFRTYDTLYRARDVFGVKSAVLVTNRFHLPRAVYVARRLGLDVVGCSSDKRVYIARAWNNRREFLARTAAWLDVNVQRGEPKYLGPKIDVEGDGRVTWDKK